MHIHVRRYNRYTLARIRRSFWFAYLWAVAAIALTVLIWIVATDPQAVTR
ncbi:hypothetical protein [Nocardia cyriacigeorgica]|nr:hypothetical protein [Nocardia cyriacigeorgica]